MQTLQQERAKAALESITDLLKHPDPDKLLSRAAELPFMIHANGLGQAAAFFKSKQGKDDKDDYGIMYRILENWLTQSGRPFAGHTDLLQA
ncbi:MAG: type III-B CRISPR module-associated protein Cmr5, partial [Vogesella sp.]|uniref:type III-B CRISPR module-associated protein Cmr5 n=1 Tax=Vogesella sp. TaxID=1904252 RepID=UPI003F3E0C26